MNTCQLIDRLIAAWAEHSGIGLTANQLAEYNSADRARERIEARENLEKFLQPGVNPGYNASKAGKGRAD